LADLFADTFACPSEVVAFLTPAGKDGYLPHHDPVDLFIVQLEGTKRWKLWDLPAQRDGDNASYTDEELGEPVIEVLLEPGDVLYLPYNTPHAAAAEDQVSLHLSIMMRPRMWKDLLRETFEQAASGPEFNQYPHIGALRDAGTEALFRQKIAALAARMDALDSGAELDRLADLGRTMPGSSHGTTFQTIAETDRITPTVLLRRTATGVGTAILWPLTVIWVRPPSFAPNSTTAAVRRSSTVGVMRSVSAIVWNVVPCELPGIVRPRSASRSSSAPLS
ncbi:JmjC domain-containing protein, partial [Streptomyces recifensis]|uniref:JmjC domain-containing protein n=1 Tax=Streptomyces recifensis TaxID=67355 RepID=UPI001ABFDB94